MKTNDSCGYYNALPHTGQIYAHSECEIANLSQELKIFKLNFPHLLKDDIICFNDILLYEVFVIRNV